MGFSIFHMSLILIGSEMLTATNFSQSGRIIDNSLHRPGGNTVLSVCFMELGQRGGGYRDTPFGFQGVADPGSWPYVIFLKVVQELYHLIPLFLVAYERPPDEDCVTDGNCQWDSLR
jgi:hypothetical protein